MKKYLFVVGFLLGIVCVVPQADAAIAFVQSTSSIVAASPMHAKFGSSVTAGDAIIVTYGWNTPNNLPVAICSDNQGDVFSKAVEALDYNQNASAGMCYALNVHGGTTNVTTTIFGAAESGGISILEYSGVATADAIDAVALNVAGTGTTGTDGVTSNAETTAVSGDLILGFSIEDGANTATITQGTGETKRERPTISQGIDMETEDYTQSTAGTASSTFTFNQAQTYITISGAFAPSGQVGQLGPRAVQEWQGSTVFGPATTGNSTFGYNLTASDTIVVPIEWLENPGDGTTTVSSVTDTRGNKFTIVTSTKTEVPTPPNYADLGIEMAYATNTAAGTDTVTVNFSRSFDDAIINLLELTSSTLDTTASKTGSSTTPNAGSVTTAANNEIGVAQYLEDDGFGVAGALTPGTGWTPSENDAGGFVAETVEYQTKAAAGVLTGSSTDLAGSGAWAAEMSAFTPGWGNGSSGSGNTVGYAWGDKIGWVNFGTSQGGFQVLTTTIIGYAWSQNFGWINFAPASSGVINDGNGNLSGYAWGQNAGYIGFSGVTIDSSGIFHGIASGSVAGNLVFDSSTGCTFCNVDTSWAPAGGGTTPLTVTSVNIDGTNPATITLTPNTTTNVTVGATITDNSCSQITGGTTTILLYRSGIASSSCLTGIGNNVSANANCYLATVFTASSTCSGGIINATTTFPVQYYAQATDASSSYPVQNWIGTVNFTDSTSATSTADSTHSTSSNDIATMLAFNIPTSTLSYGSLQASSTTGSVNQLANIENAGNASSTFQISGTALTKGATSIATSSQHYATSSFTFGGGETALSNVATTITGINIAPVIQFPVSGAGWQYGPALNGPIFGQTSVANDGYLYSIGGYNQTALTSSVLYARINATGSLGAWTSTQGMPYQLYTHNSVAYNGYIYAIAGISATSGALTSSVIYAPINATGSLGAWLFTQALPNTLTSAAAAVYSGYLYVIGGSISSATSTVLYAQINATGSLGAWTSTQALPFANMSESAAANNGYLYTIGGNATVGGNTSTVLYAQINATGSLGAWTSTQALPFKNEFSNAAYYDGYLYSVGGFNGGGTSSVAYAPINTTGSLGAWALTQPMPYSAYRFSSVIYNGYLYAVAGLNNGSPTSTVIFTPLNARSTYWGLTVPNGTPSGTYNSSLTFTATFSP